jgi:AraC-like DNA-binding protein
LTRTGIIISVIRLFTGPDWVPVECGLALEGEIGPVVREALRDARIRRTPDYGWLRLPRSILARPPRTRVPVEARAGTEADDEPALDLVGSLAQAVRPYLIQGGPSVRVAAEMAGTSVRSLQRELARAGSSYRDVLLSVKFDTACEVLKQPGANILDAAHATGFSDQAHFTRFFRSLAGSTPREYRSSQLQEDS